MPNHHTDPATGVVVEKLRRSRQRLLDLTLRNRLLNFRPGNPNYSDDLKAHKHVLLKGRTESLWQALVEGEKHIEIVGLTRDQMAQIAREYRSWSDSRPRSSSETGLSLSALRHEEWEDIRGAIRGVSQFLEKGNLISLLPEEAFHKRLTKIRNEQNTLANSTGDSALFLAVGFLEWCEPEPHPKANEPLFAPLILIHVNLDQRRTEEGGEREFRLHMDADQPQGNPCLAEKLRQDFAIDLPDLDLDEDETAASYFARVGRALRTKKTWKVHQTIALGFFNFARYRLWLDLNPEEWPEGQSPTDHPIVSSILNGDPLPQRHAMPNDEEVANHQESEDLPIVMDADSTQYAALLGAQKSISMVVQGPPGSGKSQTITNLIAVAMAQGKRVLFVAQKLPALQVVQRRLEAVELGPFCLPLFSDKARVTEMHKHLVTSARLRDGDWRRTLSNSVIATAKKLNAHATRLRGQPNGFDQSTCAMIQRAVALYLMLREAWGVEWNDELLEVSVLDVGAPPDWLEAREQNLYQWHQLKSEVGCTWSDWAPLKLGPMDTQQVEAVIRRQETAATLLIETLGLLPAEFHDQTVAKADQLVSQLNKCGFAILKDVLEKLLQFLWESPNNATTVARLERDLEEFHRQFAKAQRHLRITDENRDYVASRATEALGAIASVVSPRCSLSTAKESLNELNGILRRAEDLSAFGNLNPSGTQALWSGDGQLNNKEDLTWKHVELLANHRANLDLHVPRGAKLLLAAYVLEDATKQNESRGLAQRLARFHASTDRLKSRIEDATRLQRDTVAKELDEAANCLCQKSLGEVRLCELPELEQSLGRLQTSFREVVSHIPFGFSSSVFGSELLSIGALKGLAAMANIPVSQLKVPANGTDDVIARLAGSSEPLGVLRTFRSAVLSHQASFEESSDWFPEVQLGETVPPAILNSQREAAQIIRKLGLRDQPLRCIGQLLENVERLRKSTQASIDTFKSLFESWPLLPPETLDQLQHARALFLLLVNRPQAPAELPVEALSIQTNSEMISAAMAESRELRLFRERNSARVIFRKMPDVEAMTLQQSELRVLAGQWWRWFSGRYYTTRKKIRTFINRPFPTDDETCALLDELIAHERSRISFQTASVGTLLRGMFHGIETNWQEVAPTLAWIDGLRAATQTSETTSFVQSAVQKSENLRQGLNAVEILTQLIEQNRKELSAIVPLALLAAEPRSVKLDELRIALSRAETLLKELNERISAQITLQPDETFANLLSHIGQLEQLDRSATELSRYANLSEPRVAAQLNGAALEEDLRWISELFEQRISQELISAIFKKELDPEKHSPLFRAAQNFTDQIVPFWNAYLDKETVQWLSEEVVTLELENSLALLIRTVAVSNGHARECTFDSQLNILEIRESLDDAYEIEEAKKAFVPWRAILCEEPSLLSADQITETLDWLELLRQHGASGALLRWILAEETDNRLHWWQEMTSRAGDLRTQLRKLQDSFALPLHGMEPVTLLAWSSQIADRRARTISALEIVESYSQSSDFTVQDLAQAAAGLNRAIQLEADLRSWRERLGQQPTHLEVARIQNHRQWVAIARGLPSSLGNWLTAGDTSSRCEVLLGIESKVADLKKTTKQIRDCLESYGRLSSYGPFGVLSLNGTPREIEGRCKTFVTKMPLLPSYAALLREQETAKKLGLGNLIKHSEKSTVSASILIDTFRGAVAYQQAKSVWESDDELRYFQSNEHERLRQKFQIDDEQQLKTNRRFVKTRIGNGSITEGARGRTAGEHTEFNLLMHETSKQRRHLPIRKLVNRAGRAMQDLCPCWMMTPLAVAQFLAPGDITFDLIIMDEASQINPEDAWGAIARGKQLIVVGDQKQMPPSDFFMSALEEDESPEDDDEIDGGKSESILDASVASLLSCPLLWHYRSRQETLIAPANSFSYDNRLILFPHPHRNHPELGIRYTHITNGTTTTGKVTNTLEAEAVAKRVRELVLREYAKPVKDRLTIGVVTMNLHQQDCVMDLLEKMRQDEPRFDFAMTALASGQNEEPLFVRNLENIQGDERDIMILSCTYGPHTPGGTPTQRFGPLNREGGERRFNVLITRAKWRMEIFSSIRSDQIIADGRRQGVRDFHLFLKYAESGILVDRGEPTGKQSDSPFEVQVEGVLRRAGFETERQIGVAGYFIDLAVKHPHHKGLFALGIECDGKTYHSSRAARDRDRLREKVLMERGWKLHRIWSTDWFVNPLQAKKRLIDAVNAACR